MKNQWKMRMNQNISRTIQKSYKLELFFLTLYFRKQTKSEIELKLKLKLTMSYRNDQLNRD